MRTDKKVMAALLLKAHFVNHDIQVILLYGKNIQ
jgi:hypothetical protein